MRNTCCPGIRHACIGLLLLHAVTAQDTSDFGGDEFSAIIEIPNQLVNRCQKNEFWCKKEWYAYSSTGERYEEGTLEAALTPKSHKCQCVNVNIDNSGCCVVCGWGEYCDDTEFVTLSGLVVGPKPFGTKGL